MKKTEKKNRPRAKIGELLFELMGELAIALIFVLVGAGAYWLFGKQNALERIDWDTLSVIGIAVLIGVFYAVAAIVHLIKKKRKSSDTKNPEAKE